MTSSIMKGFRALDFTDEKGFLCGKILADLGVDVIKIEKPGGDRSRRIPPFYHNEADPEKSLYWFAYNTNKRGITLDLDIETGRDLFRKMVEKADFVIESFPPGHLAKLRLDYNNLAKINPRIIMTSITPFGQDGPYSKFLADSDIVLQALGTMLGRTGEPDRPPLQISSIPQSYMHAGADAAEGTMIAHYHRSLTGEGQHVDVSIMESIIGDPAVIGDFNALGQETKRTGNLFMSAGLYIPSIWECRDGFVFYMIRGGMAGSRTNKALTGWMDSEGMAPDFMKNKDWDKWDWINTTQEELDAMAEAIRKFFKTHIKDELNKGSVTKNEGIGKVVDELGVQPSLMISKVYDICDLMEDEQLKFRDFWVKVDHDELGQSIIYPGAFAKFSLTPIEQYRHAPHIGEHNHEVFKEFAGAAQSDVYRSKEAKGKWEKQTKDIDSQALRNVKILGFVTDGVGPIVTRVLAMYGARVVQVESEKRPDGTRLRSPFKNNEPGVNHSYRYVLTNPGKYSMCLDMKHPDSKKVTERLVKWADIVIDNFRPGVLEKWQLSYKDLCAINPDIIMASLSARGQTGPFRTAAGYGGEISGITGFTALTGWPDRSPVGIGPYTDAVVPHFGVVSILAALDYHDRTGKGQYIDISQPEAAIQFLIPAILDYTANKKIQTRNGNRCAYAAPHGAYRCKGDDQWCTIAVFSEAEWSAFRKATGSPEWTKEPKFSTLAERKLHEDELNDLVEKWTVNLTSDEVMKKMREAGIKAGAVRNLRDIMESDPQLKHRRHWRHIMQPEIGTLILRGSSYILSKTPYHLEKPAPLLGEHTEYVCRKFLKMSDEEFVNLYSRDVFK